MGEDNEYLIDLLEEFVTSDGIEDYDSKLCWGCGEPKESRGGKCDPDCLLERTRKVISGDIRLAK